jgi:transcriptional regulator with XRE-family HTH domain
MNGQSAERQRLASILRALRIDAGLSTTQLARVLEWSQSKVSKTERGETLPPEQDVELWARHTKASPQVRYELMELAGGAAVQATRWKRELAPGRRRKQEDIQRLEANASVVRVFAQDVVVGLAQTRPYAEAMFRLGRDVGADEPLDEIVDARMARQASLDNLDRRFEFLITETSLRRRLISTAEMRQQIRHLIELSRRPNITLEVITFDATERVHQYHGFAIIGDPSVDQEAIVLAETVTRGLAIRAAEEIQEYIEHFTALRESAIGGKKVRTFLQEVIKSLPG